MKSAEQIFVQEFKQMQAQLRASNPMFDMYSLEIPKESLGNIVTRDMVYIKGIPEEYYDKLNNTEAMIWSHGKLCRRTFDYKGEYIKDDNGNYVTKDVTLPHECIAVISTVKIGVPVKFKPKQAFDFVDCITRTLPDGTKETCYVYIVPRKYCYKLNQTALVMSMNKLRTYYSGACFALRNGYSLYLYVVPYRPTTNRAKSYRVLATKTDIDYSTEIGYLMNYWLSKGVLYPPQMCELYEGLEGKNSVAVEEFASSIEEYVRYNPEKNLAKIDTLNEMWGDDEDCM